MINYLQEQLLEEVSTHLAQRKKLKYYCRLYQVHPQIPILIFSKIQAEKDCFTTDEIECLINLIVKLFNLDYHNVIWIENYSSKGKKLAYDVFSLVIFNWHNGKASDPRSVPILEDWHFFWLNSSFLLEQQLFYESTIEIMISLEKYSLLKNFVSNNQDCNNKKYFLIDY